jgi:peptidoglycan/xylan/chitin deacetylase (PgdA/CDA1 family)
MPGLKGRRLLWDTPILMYHSVCVGRPHPGGVPREALRAHLGWLAERGWNGVSMRDHLREPGSHDVCLTFDDGYLNNLTHALPLLAEFGFKATFFVCTRLERQALEWHRADPQPIMGADGWRELHSHGHEVASHGMTHRRVTELPVEEARAELVTSRLDLEAVVGPVAGYAFPQGRFNAQVLEIARTEYSYACTTRPRGRLQQDRWTLKRLNIGPADGLRRFRLKMSPAFRIACDLGL